MIPSGFVWYSTKGGATKSTHTAHHAVLSAQSGWKVLVLDLDPQGNQARLLGFYDNEEWDGGAGLVAAAKGERPLQVIKRDPELGEGVVDVVGGGQEAAELDAVFQMALAQGRSYLLQEMLEPLADQYDLILFDLPAKPSALQTMTLSTAHYMVMPVGPGDDTHLDGINGAVKMYGNLRRGWNPHLEILGVVIGPWDSRSNELGGVEARITDIVAGTVPVLRPVTRLCPGVARDLVRLGLTAPELDQLAKEAKRRRLAWLRQRGKGGEGVDEPGPETFKDAARLAADYRSLIKTVNSKFSERQGEFAKQLVRH